MSLEEEETLDERKYFGYNSRHACLRRLRSTTPAAKKNLIERSPEWLNLSVCVRPRPYLLALPVWGRERKGEPKR